MRNEHPDRSRSPASTVRGGAVVLGAAALCWFVGEQGLAAVAAKTGSPALLQAFDPGAHPAPGAKLAQAYLAANDSKRALRYARPSAIADPMNVRAVRTLGLALDVTKDRAASAVMRVAEKLSWRDTPTSLWVMRDAALQRDYMRVMDQLNALARRQVEPKLVQQLFHASLDDAASRRAIATTLAKSPPWRGAFFADARVNLVVPSYGRMEALLNALDRTKAPSTPAERMTLIDRMVDTGQGAAARDFWVRSFAISTKASTQHPYDPNFVAVGSRSKTRPVSPFEWQASPEGDQFLAFRKNGAGYVVDLTPATDAGVSLLTQTLVLTPGVHRIDADVIQGSAQQGPAEWQMSCSPSNAPLIRSFAVQGNALTGVTVTIPAAGCAVQTLALVTNDRLSAQPVTIGSVAIR